MTAPTTQGVSGHRGLLAVIAAGVAREITGAEGATWNWNLNAQEWGGFGMNHKRGVQVMPGAPTIEVENQAWDTADDVIHDMMVAMLNGTGYTFYLYPRGQVTQAYYLYGEFTLNEASLEMSVDDIIRQPFGLIAQGDTYRVGM